MNKIHLSVLAQAGHTSMYMQTDGIQKPVFRRKYELTQHLILEYGTAADL
jgi:hypothetical protein